MRPTSKPASIVLSIGVLLGAAKGWCGQAPSTQRSVTAVAPAAATDAQAGPYYALVIGNSKYTNLPKLTTPGADATALAKVLREQYGFETTVLLDATRPQILDALVEYRKSLHDNANLLIFYAGHGYLDREADQAYWLPVDARSDTNDNWISTDDIARRIRPLAPRHVLVISDSCYSGAILSDESATQRSIPGGGISTEYASYVRKMQSLVSRDWMASGSKEPVEDGGAPGHSIFAAALLRGLKETSEPEFAAFDLFSSYVRRKVAGNSGQLPQYGSIRESGDDLGDFIFTRKVTPPVVVKGTKEPVARSTGEPVVRSAREMEDLGWNYIHGLGGLPQDDVQAASWFRKAAEAGDSNAMSNLGFLYANGRGGLPQDDVQAVSWYRKSTEAGNSQAMDNLGLMYLNGRGGLPKDEVEAVSWFRKAGEAGNSRTAMRHLGLMYRDGRGGLPKDEAQAVSWFRKAAEAGEINAMDNLGLMYRDGRGGLLKDEVQAASWYRKAAEAGQANAMFNLAAMYEHGRGGLPHDKIQALNWYRKGAAAGDPDAAAAVKRLSQ